MTSTFRNDPRPIASEEFVPSTFIKNLISGIAGLARSFRGLTKPAAKTQEATPYIDMHAKPARPELSNVRSVVDDERKDVELGTSNGKVFEINGVKPYTPLMASDYPRPELKNFKTCVPQERVHNAKASKNPVIVAEKAKKTALEFVEDGSQISVSAGISPFQTTLTTDIPVFAEQSSTQLDINAQELTKKEEVVHLEPSCDLPATQDNNKLTIAS